MKVGSVPIPCVAAKGGMSWLPMCHAAPMRLHFSVGAGLGVPGVAIGGNLRWLQVDGKGEW